MPFNGSGVYSAPGADFPVVTQTVISSTHFNNVINDISTALSLCLTKDGQQTATANINFGGFRATNVGITGVAGSVGTPAINVSDVGTGLYRSAASELAVTVAGTQRGRFDSTGLIVTGVGTFSGALSTTTLTATTSVVASLVGTGTDAQAGLGVNSVVRWAVQPSASNYDLWPVSSDNTQSLGTTTGRIKQVFTPIIDSGTTGSLSLKTNNGTLGFQIVHNASAVNYIDTIPAPTTANPALRVVNSSDTNVGLDFIGRGTGTFTFYSRGDVAAKAQFQIIDTASSTRNITVTGSNGGNPTLGTTAGSLNISSPITGALTIKRKTADETVTSSAVLQDDDHLTFAIAANEEWVATYYIDAGDTMTATGVKAAITVPAGATMLTDMVQTPVVTGSVISPAGGRTTTSGTAALNQATSGGNTCLILVTVWVLNGATPGNVTLQWAQGTSNGSALIFRKGSFLQATRIA